MFALYKRAHLTAEPQWAQMSGSKTKYQGPPKAGPGVKGGHCSDAYKSLSTVGGPLGPIRREAFRPDP